jgi:PAS domain S-box-containing protein
LDSAPERAFDRITELAQRLLHAPVALISLVDEQRQFFKSAQGLAEPWASRRQTPLSHSFCQYVVTSGEPLCIENALTDPLVAQNGAVSDLAVIAYLGVPVHAPQGEVLGSLCVIDHAARAWRAEEMATLQELVAIVEDEIALRLHLQWRVAAEVETRQNERRLRDVIDNLFSFVGLMTPDGRLIEANQTALQAANLTPADVLDKPFAETYWWSFSAESQARLRAAIVRAAAGERVRYDVPVRIAADQYIVIDFMLGPIFDEAGQVTHLVPSGLDISERKAAEAQVQLLAATSAALVSSLDYEQTIQQVAQLVVAWFAEWCVVELVTANEQLETIALAHQADDGFVRLQQVRPRHLQQLKTSYGRGKVLASGVSEFYPLLNDAILSEVAHDEAHLQTLRAINPTSTMIVPLLVRGTAVGTATFVRTGRSKAYSPTDLQLAEDLAGRLAQTVDNVRLYHSARAAEAELRTLNETLEQQVATRTNELARRNQELDRFAYVASHDLKAPLRAIDSLSSWVVEDAKALLPAASQAHLLKLRERVQRMENLLDDLLAYSRADRLRGQLQTIDINQLVANIVALVAPPTFVIETPTPLPTITGIRVPLETVLRNLIGNAVKHHNRDSGRIVITACACVNQQAAAPYIEIAVTDDGPGIDPAFHQRIFEIFETLQPRDRLEGSGIGLSIVKKIVESHGGTVRVESALGAGATFRFTWPQSPLVHPS